MRRQIEMRGQLELSGRIDFKRNAAYSVGGPLSLGQSRKSTYTRSGIAMFKLGCQGGGSVKYDYCKMFIEIKVVVCEEHDALNTRNYSAKFRLQYSITSRQKLKYYRFLIWR